MGLDIGGPHRLERPITHVQGDLSDLDTASRKRAHDTRRKVQTRGRRGHRAADPRKHRLVAILVRRFGRALDIWRKWSLPNRIDHRINIVGPIREEAHDATAMEPSREHLHDEARTGGLPVRARMCKYRPRPFSELLTRMNEHIPAIFFEPGQNQALDPTT